jgi:superoxide dismutase, Fe-Mn family
MSTPDDYGALEPAISGKIMELHHSKHHNTYVTSFNNATEQMAEARHKENIQAQIALQPLINFHGGALAITPWKFYTKHLPETANRLCD